MVEVDTCYPLAPHTKGLVIATKTKDRRNLGTAGDGKSICSYGLRMFFLFSLPLCQVSWQNHSLSSTHLPHRREKREKPFGQNHIYLTRHQLIVWRPAPERWHSCHSLAPYARAHSRLLHDAANQALLMLSHGQ